MLWIVSTDGQRNSLIDFLNDSRLRRNTMKSMLLHSPGDENIISMNWLPHAHLVVASRMTMHATNRSVVRSLWANAHLLWFHLSTIAASQTDRKKLLTETCSALSTPKRLEFSIEIRCTMHECATWIRNRRRKPSGRTKVTSNLHWSSPRHPAKQKTRKLTDDSFGSVVCQKYVWALAKNFNLLKHQIYCGASGELGVDALMTSNSNF